MGLAKKIPYRIVGFMAEFPFNERLAAVLRERGMTPYALARKTGLPDKTVYGWINNPEANPGIQYVKRLADALNVPVGYIADYSSETAGSSVRAIQVERCPLSPEERPPPETCELMTMALEVIQSKSPYSTALSENIKAFHRAMRVESGLPPSGECKARGETG